MVWLAFIGILLQAGGLLLAVKGVSETYCLLHTRRLRGDLSARLSSWFREAVLRRPRPTDVVEPHGAIHGVSFGDTANVEVRPTPITDSSTPEERFRYLERYVEVVVEEVQAVRKHSDEALARAEERTNQKVDQLRGQLHSADSRLRHVQDALAGKDGRGLQNAAIGILLTIVGVLLTVAGLPWDQG